MSDADEGNVRIGLRESNTLCNIKRSLRVRYNEAIFQLENLHQAWTGLESGRQELQAYSTNMGWIAGLLQYLRPLQTKCCIFYNCMSKFRSLLDTNPSRPQRMWLINSYLLSSLVPWRLYRCDHTPEALQQKLLVSMPWDHLVMPLHHLLTIKTDLCPATVNPPTDGFRRCEANLAYTVTSTQSKSHATNAWSLRKSSLQIEQASSILLQTHEQWESVAGEREGRHQNSSQSCHQQPEPPPQICGLQHQLASYHDCIYDCNSLYAGRPRHACKRQILGLLWSEHLACLRVYMLEGRAYPFDMNRMLTLTWQSSGNSNRMMSWVALDKLHRRICTQDMCQRKEGQENIIRSNHIHW